MEHYKNLDLADIVYFCEFDQVEKIEQWKDVLSYEGIYQVSDLGRIKSLRRIVLRNRKYPFLTKDKILKSSINSNGYRVVSLFKNNKQKTKKIHQLVAITFLNHIVCGHELVVNHINFDRLDNRVLNLEIVTTRENSNLKHIKSSSKYTGVSFCKKTNKWYSYITIGKKRISLGYFESEIESSRYYENALISINNGTEIKSNCKKIVKTSKYKGIGMHKTSGKYRSRIVINGKLTFLGLFENELDAVKARDKSILKHGLKSPLQFYKPKEK